VRTATGSNPVNCIDTAGHALDFILDIGFAGYSLWEACKDPSPATWGAFLLDVACIVIPFVTSGGAAVRAGAKYGDDALAAAAKGGGNATDAGRMLNRIESGADTASGVVSYTKKELANARKRAVAQAWKLEQADVMAGGNGISKVWTDLEKSELISNGKVAGYVGHHMKSVSEYPQLAGDPTNIQFLLYPDHFKAHGYNWRNPTHGRYIE